MWNKCTESEEKTYRNTTSLITDLLSTMVTLPLQMVGRSLISTADNYTDILSDSTGTV
jgi:hypothetical protein